MIKDVFKRYILRQRTAAANSTRGENEGKKQRVEESETNRYK